MNSIRLSSGDDGTDIEGTLISAGETTLGQSGVRKKWPRSALEHGLSTLEGVPLLHSHDENVRNTVGKVVDAWMEGARLRFRATLYDSELYSKIKNGLSSVSLAGRHEAVESMDETSDGAKIVTELSFRHVALVTRGAAPSATVSPAELPSASDEVSPSLEATAAALADGRQAFALSTGSIDIGNESKDMISLQISESTEAQLIEIRKGSDQFDESSTLDEVVSYAAASAGAPTEEQVEAEQERLSRKYSNREVTPGRETDESTSAELSESEKSKAARMRENLRERMNNR